MSNDYELINKGIEFYKIKKKIDKLSYEQIIHEISNDSIPAKGKLRPFPNETEEIITHRYNEIIKYFKSLYLFELVCKIRKINYQLPEIKKKIIDLFLDLLPYDKKIFSNYYFHFFKNGNIEIRNKFYGEKYYNIVIIDFKIRIFWDQVRKDRYPIINFGVMSSDRRLKTYGGKEYIEDYINDSLRHFLDCRIVNSIGMKAEDKI